MKRPPEATAKVLVLCVELHLQGQPFPPHKDVAAHLGVSIALVERVLSQRVATKDIRVERKYIKGNAKKYPSSKQQQVVTPSNALIKIVKAAR